jgi:hypothetical protein
MLRGMSKIVQQMTDGLVPILQQTVIPLHKRDGPDDLVASGVLFRLGARSFLVSAAHVLRSVDPDAISLSSFEVDPILRTRSGTIIFMPTCSVGLPGRSCRSSPRCPSSPIAAIHWSSL